jgi:hypothetical protein
VGFHGVGGRSIFGCSALGRGAPGHAKKVVRNGNLARDFCCHCIRKKSGIILRSIQRISTQMPDDPASPVRKLGKHGGPRVRGQGYAKAGDVTLPRQRGHSREYILSRLEREGHTDWIAAIESGRLSAYAAAVELGWVKRPPTQRQNSNQAKRRRFNVQALIG